ncbi:MAG: ribosome recycling factor [Pseudomonadota bacterium]|nr:ribosome recycling factor [Pseudomonadota bacterium]
MINEIISDARERMSKSVDSLNDALVRIRTGRANKGILDPVTIDYYGTPTKVAQVANISVEEGRTLVISPWEKHLIPQIEKAIMASDVGITPSTTGDLIRLTMPPLTEETRKELVKQAKAEAENAKIAVRNIRRDANSDIKELLKEKEITEDEERQGEANVQKVTDEAVEKIDGILALKEEELLTI